MAIPTPIRTAALMLTGVAALGALTGCGGSSDATPAGSASGGSGSAGSTSTGSVSATPTDDGSTPQLNTAPASRSGAVPTPTGDQRKRLLYILKAVDPGMGTDESALVSKSMKLCGHMLAGDSTSELNSQTQKLFTRGSYTPQDYQVMAIQLAITAEFCR